MNKKNILSVLVVLGAALTSCGNAETEQNNTVSESKDNTAVVIENIMTRTSIRKFTDEAIGKDTLTMLVKAGMAAPSAMDKRPWSFIVITERNVLDSLRIVHPFSNLKTATAAIVVCGEKAKTGEGKIGEYWVQDCSAATENILLAAHAYGLGAVWCGIYPNEEIMPAIKRVLKIPAEITPLSLVTLGYPAENPEPKDKWNPEDVHYQTWE